jgi:hypothetical protein
MRNGKRTTLGPLAAALIMLVVLVMPASAQGNMQISGIGVFETSDQCTDLPDPFYPSIVMTGDLVGCWYTTDLEVTHFTESGSYQERGAETFVGCLSDGTTCGAFDTSYQFEAKLAADLSEIRGHCEHKLVSGTGDFAGITGEIFFKDDVTDSSNPIYNYRGHYSLR